MLLFSSLSNALIPVRSTARLALGAAGTVKGFMVCLLGVLGLAPMLPAAVGTGPDGPVASGVNVRTEVIAIWVPQAVLDRTRQRPGPRGEGAPEDGPTPEQAAEPGSIAYALTYRGHQEDGGFSDIVQVRRNDEVAAHAEEYRRVLSAASGDPPCTELLEFCHAEVHPIPDSFLHPTGDDPAAAWTRLMRVSEAGRP